MSTSVLVPTILTACLTFSIFPVRLHFLDLALLCPIDPVVSFFNYFLKLCIYSFIYLEVLFL